ncbi:MAG: uroporphyrinogen decarboxylase [Bacteroidales bacterium]|nr:uroporphyrinogen decarboxylase [Bacteroidales bacterium]MCF6342743.1 uroporphyrinogen decarboxylase [Bacteroidales bacterium]
MMTDVFTDTIKGIKRERPPVWFMRQAGRVIPEYLKLREKYSFHQLMRTPELAAEVTLQPVRLLGVDAAILFSDILVIPEAMGMKLAFTDKGPRFDTALKDVKDPLSFLDANPEKLNHIYDAIDAIMATRPASTPLIGFCGAPLTTLFYMVQGISSNHQFPDAVEMMYRDKETTNKLFEAVTDLSIEYALKQVKHGISAFQLFDTHAGLVPYPLYHEMVMPHVRRILRAVQETGTPVIFFPKGLGAGMRLLKDEKIDFVGVDWQMSIEDAKAMLGPQTGVQGNLDPRILTSDLKTIQRELEKFLPFGSKEHKWIFNLGHGVLPNIPFGHLKFVVDWIKSTDWNRN